MKYSIDYTNGSYWLYPSIIRKGLSILHYSGDLDSLTATITTSKWIDMLRSDEELALEVPWQPWLVEGNAPDDPKQVGGFYSRYTPNFEFVTMRGGGHMALLTHSQTLFQILDGMLGGRHFVQ